MSNQYEDKELRKKLAKLYYEHYPELHSKNLGQYKAEYGCVCGFSFITDGHDPKEIGANARHREHLLDVQMQLITQKQADAYNQAIYDVKKAGYGYDDGTGFVLKISYAELGKLKKGLPQ